VSASYPNCPPFRPFHGEAWRPPSVYHPFSLLDRDTKELGKKGIVCLEVFIKALRRRWEELVPGTKDPDSAGLIDKSINDDYKRLALGRRCAGVKPGPASDPIYIYELRAIIEAGYHFRRMQRMQRPRWPANLLSTKYGIPLEIMYLTSEYLSINELQTMTTALNEQFPVGFWRRQISDIFFRWIISVQIAWTGLCLLY
jgi:hypothetical protein